MLYCPVIWTKSVCFPSLYQWRMLLRAEIVSQGSHWYVCECVGLSECEQRSGLDPGTGLSYCTDLELDLVPWPGAKSSGHWVTAAKTELRIKYENTEILSIFYNICQRLNISKSTWFPQHHGEAKRNRPWLFKQRFWRGCWKHDGFIWKRGNWQKKGQIQLFLEVRVGWRLFPRRSWEFF